MSPEESGGDGAPEPDAFTSPVSRERYCEIVETAKAYIRAGDVFQVVPSHRLRAPFTRDPFALYRSLRRTNPSPFLFFLDFGSFHLAGSSPEILVRLRDGKITIRPIAGTRPRGATPEEDLRLEQERVSPHVRLIGQIANQECAAGVPDVPVLLLSRNSVLCRTATNNFGEFAMEYAPSKGLRIFAPIPGENLEVRLGAVSSAPRRIVRKLA